MAGRKLRGGNIIITSDELLNDRKHAMKRYRYSWFAHSDSCVWDDIATTSLQGLFAVCVGSRVLLCGLKRIASRTFLELVEPLTAAHCFSSMLSIRGVQTNGEQHAVTEYLFREGIALLYLTLFDGHIGFYKDVFWKVLSANPQAESARQSTFWVTICPEKVWRNMILNPRNVKVTRLRFSPSFWYEGEKVEKH